MKHLIAPILCPLLFACGADQQPETPVGPRSGRTAPDTGAPAEGHGEHFALGTVGIRDHRFAVARLGDLEPGEEGAFEVELLAAPEGTDLADLNVYLWIEDSEDRQVSAPGKGSVEDGHLHFHVTPRADAKDLHRVVLRLRAGGFDERAGLPLSGHGHEHGDSPHGGVVAALLDEKGDAAGHLELKLHDDKGDLELWLGKDGELAEPLDVPLDTEVTLTLVDLDGKEVVLRARDRDRNPDEEGKPNVRDGRTNYFVFPGASGADPSFLKGRDFQSIAVVKLSANGAALRSEEFVLVPHVH